jgi:hypothetical protein
MGHFLVRQHVAQNRVEIDTVLVQRTQDEGSTRVILLLEKGSPCCPFGTSNTAVGSSCWTLLGGSEAETAKGRGSSRHTIEGTS